MSPGVQAASVNRGSKGIYAPQERPEGPSPAHTVALARHT